MTDLWPVCRFVIFLLCRSRILDFADLFKFSDPLFLGIRSGRSLMYPLVVRAPQFRSGVSPSALCTSSKGVESG